MILKTVQVTGHMGNGMTIELACGKHKVYIDQPTNAGGADLGPTPLEMMLAAYAGCLGSIGRIVAHQEKINLRGMQFTVAADYDPAHLLGQETTARAGFQEIRVNVEIDAELDDAAKQDFLERVEARCPVFDNLGNQTHLVTQLVK